MVLWIVAFRHDTVILNCATPKFSLQKEHFGLSRFQVLTKLTWTLEVTYSLVEKLSKALASLSQTTDFAPGYIAERACREELLDLTGMMTSLTQ
jgi:hypothetical protein